jgi:FlgD Ig-like domain/Cohesin domain/Dockerin type I domain
MKLRLLLLVLLAVSIDARSQVTNATQGFPSTDLPAALAAASIGDNLVMDPGLYDTVVTVIQDVTLTPDPAGVSVKGMILSNGCTVTLQGSLTITKTLALGTGYLFFPPAYSADRLIMAAGAKVTRSTGYVMGTMEKFIDVPTSVVGANVPVRFEIGDATPKCYTPVDLNFYNVEVGIGGSFIVSTTSGEFGPLLSSSCINPTRNVNRKYTIVNNGMTYNNYKAMLTFLPSDIDPGASYLMFRVATDSADVWDSPVIQPSGPTYVVPTGKIFWMRDFYIGEQVTPIQAIPPSNATGVLPNCTLNWNSAVGATSYLFELYQDTTKAMLAGTRVTDTLYTIIYPRPSLGYDTMYYWRVRAAYGNVVSGWSPIDSFRVGTPDSVISNDIVRMHFIHKEGRIDSLRFMYGSQRELLYQSLNTSQKGGLNRVNNEAQTKCTNWGITNTSSSEGAAFFDYYASYGTKRVDMIWRSDSGFVMNTTYTLGSAVKFTPGVYWSPGGDVGPLYDFITVIDTTGKKITRYSGYPGKDSVLYNGFARGSAMFDSRFQETFGFKTNTVDSLYAATGTALNGPYNRGTYKGVVTRQFAIKPSAIEYWAWVDTVQEPFSTVTAADGGAIWFSGDPVFVTWQSRGDLAGEMVDVKLSTNGGRTFLPTPVASDPINSGSCTFTVPTNISSTNCRIRIELTRRPELNGMNPVNFTIRPVDAVVFTTLPSVTTAPGETFILPYYIDPNGKNVYAFGTRIKFNASIFSLSNSRTGMNLPIGWNVSVVDSSARGFVQVGGICRTDSSNFPLQYSDTVVVFKFTVKPTARVGWVDTLQIENSYLEAADNSARLLPVNGQDCPVILNSALSGSLRYYSNNKVLGSGKVVLTYTGLGNMNVLPIDSVCVADTLGKYNFTPIPPGAIVSLTVRPSADTGNAAIDTSITAADALLAFAGRDGGSTVLTGYQKIAADVNGDGRVTATDAFAILQRSSGLIPKFEDVDTTIIRGNWVFVDSSYKMTSFNWQAAPKKLMYYQLDTSRLKESFYGILLGDVQPTFIGKSISLAKDYVGSEVRSTDGAFAAGSVQFSVAKRATASIGDTISVPIVLNANKNLLGSFNATLHFNTTMLKYAGQFVRGTNLPGMQTWQVSVSGSNTSGKVTVAAADLEQHMKPISGSGEAVTLKFVVLGSNKWLDSTDISFSHMSATDTLASNFSVGAINGRIVTSGKTGVPASFALMQNYPNPFNPTTHLSFALPEPALVSMSIYNILGQLVRSYAESQLSPGYHELMWDARNNNNVSVASGVYFYRLSVVSASGAKFSDVKRMMLLK